MSDAAKDGELQLQLAEIVSQTACNAQYAPYHAKVLQFAVQSMEQQHAG